MLNIGIYTKYLHKKDLKIILNEGKNIIEELKANEIKYRAIFEQAGDSIITIDPKTGELCEFNNKAYENLGYTREEFERVKIPDFEVIESPEEVKQHIEKIIRNGAEVFETKHRTKDGKIREISVNCRVISIHGKKYIQSIFRDITETNEQVRLLDCLYGISKLVEEPGMTIKEIITGTLNLIPLAWLFPKLTCARIIYDEKEYCTENFKETKWKLSTNIKINKKLLKLEVYSLDDRLFLKGEVNFINDIGKRLKVIIEQNKAKQKLKDSEQKFKALFNKYKSLSHDLNLILDNIPALIFYKDLNNNFIRVNKYLADAQKLPKESFEGKSLFDIYPKKVAQDYWDDDLEVVNSKMPKLNIEEPWVTDQGIRWVSTSKIPIGNNSGKIESILGISTDITNRKNSEQKLRESEQKFKALFNNINDPILIHDHGGKFIEVNKRACDVLGYSKEEFMNLNPKDIAPPRIIKLLPEMIKTLYEKGYNAFESEFLTKDGRIIPVELNSRIFDYKEKQAIITITRDITKRKQSELKLKESETRYREAFDRTTFYKDLLTHDMNNILQVIQLTLEISSLDENISKKLKELLESIENHVLRGAKLISNVHKLSQLEESQKFLQNIDICNVLKDSLDFLKNSFQMKNINIKVDTPRKNYLVKANDILREVFENILINAVKYNENSTVEILIRFSEEQKERINYIKVEFMDNGRGIPDAIKKIIFHKGFLEEKQSKGMGIGLTLVKKAIETYNGQIWVEDKITGDYSKGSNFILLIPEAD